MKVYILTSMLLMMPIIAAADTVYQWVDENGNAIYSDKPPPPGTQVIEKDLKPIPGNAITEPAPGITPESVEELTVAERVEWENAQLMQRRLIATTREESLEIECGLAKAVIDTLSSGKPANIANEDGMIRRMSGAEIQERMRVSQKYIDDYCH